MLGVDSTISYEVFSKVSFIIAIVHTDSFDDILVQWCSVVTCQGTYIQTSVGEAISIDGGKTRLDVNMLRFSLTLKIDNKEVEGNMMVAGMAAVIFEISLVKGKEDSMQQVRY